MLDLYPLSRSLFPVKALEKRSFKGGNGWIEVDTPSGEFHALAKGKHYRAIILSHGCQIDKPNKNVKVQLAPIAPLSVLPEKEREFTLAQKNRKQLPLPLLPGVGDSYADLQSILAIDVALLSACARIASMTPAGIKRLQMQLISFFTHKDFGAFLDGLPDLPEHAQKAPP